MWTIDCGPSTVTLHMLYIQFFMSAALIVAAGVRLTTRADALSDRLKLGKVWVGIVLLGIITSLPEAVASLTAVISLQANDLAIGNMVGSNNFNLMLIVVMDMLYRNGSVTNKIGYNRSNTIPAVFAMMLALVVIGDIYLNSHGFSFQVGHVGLGSFLIVGLYVSGMAISKNICKQGQLSVYQPEPEGFADNNVSLARIYTELSISTVIVVLSAIWLTNTAEDIARATGLGQTFVGTIFLAFATSLPEMVVTLSALKIGVLDLAIGNIFGSNIANIFILSICDFCYRTGNIFFSVSKTHMMTAGLSIVLTLIVLGGFRNNTKKTIGRLGWDSWLLLILFLSGLMALYYFK